MDRLRLQARLRPNASWYQFKNSSAETTELIVYDEIGGWFGISANDFMNDLRTIMTPRINLRLNSVGGNVFDGIAIANALRSHPATVTTYVDGIAASIASVIALAGNKIIMQPGSQMMIHESSGGCVGFASDMRQMADLLDFQSDNIASMYAERAGGKPEDWRALMEAETWYTAKEAVAAGLADLVAEYARPDEEDESEPEPETKPEDLLKAKWDLSCFRYAGRENAPAPPLNQTTETLVTSEPKNAEAPADAPERERPTAEPVVVEATPEPTEPVEPETPEEVEEEEVPPADTAFETTDDPSADDVPEPAPAPSPPEGFTGEWGDAVAHLVQDQLTWADVIAHLTSSKEAACQP